MFLLAADLWAGEVVVLVVVVVRRQGRVCGVRGVGGGVSVRD